EAVQHIETGADAFETVVQAPAKTQRRNARQVLAGIAIPGTYIVAAHGQVEIAAAFVDAELAIGLDAAEGGLDLPEISTGQFAGRVDCALFVEHQAVAEEADEVAEAGVVGAEVEGVLAGFPAQLRVQPARTFDVEIGVA